MLIFSFLLYKHWRPSWIGAGKVGQGGQKNWHPMFLCFIAPKGPLNQKLENECKNRADHDFCDISTSTITWKENQLNLYF